MIHHEKTISFHSDEDNGFTYYLVVTVMNISCISHHAIPYEAVATIHYHSGFPWMGKGEPAIVNQLVVFFDFFCTLTIIWDGWLTHICWE